MKKYKTSVIEVEAVQWRGRVDELIDILQWINNRVGHLKDCGSEKDTYLYVYTDSNDCNVYIRKWDWIARLPNGLFQTYKDKEFVSIFRECEK